MQFLSLLLSTLLLASRTAALESFEYSAQDTNGEEIKVRLRRAVGSGNTSATQSPSTTPKPEVFQETHTFYHATYIWDDEMVNNYKRVFEGYNRLFRYHTALSTAHRRAVQIKLSFNFLFYGHAVNKVTIATGGFLYMSDYLHKYLTFAQYIAPLMTDFDTSIGAGDISYADNGEAFFVRWEKVHIKGQAEIGNFTFEAILHKNGTIIFVYEQIPVRLSKINSSQHSLKVGVSDAYYLDEASIGNYFTRRIIRYNALQLSQSRVQQNAIIILHPLPTCVEQDSCSKCISAKTGFNCNWCSVVERCSSGIDRLRQKWEQNGCHRVEKTKDCPARKMDPAVLFFIILLILLLIASLIGLFVWIWYAYTHPTSRSGIFLMEHRPSVMVARFSKWRRGDTDQQASDIYRVEGNSTA